MPQLLTRTVSLINWKKLAFSLNHCPLCGGKRAFVRLDADAISVRCLSCRATSITLSLVAVLKQVLPELNSRNVYELSSRGSLMKFLERTSKTLSCSEYFSDTIPGEYKNGVQCQDVQKLTHSNESFDLCTSTEVFEHVPDDAKGFAEIHRVLKPNGILIFTVPLDPENKTVERATLMPGGEIKHVLPPEYHSDPIRGHEPILAFRNYGYDVLRRLINAGFTRAEIRKPECDLAWSYASPVIVAYRGKAPIVEVESDPSLLRFASK